MKITFQEVKNYLLNNSNNAIESIVDATEPFVMDYIKYPLGFAETDNINDIDQLLKDIDNTFIEFKLETDGRIRRGMINHVIKKETQRWNEGKNAWYYGRHIARLGYLLNKKQ